MLLICVVLVKMPRKFAAEVQRQKVYEFLIFHWPAKKIEQEFVTLLERISVQT